MKGGVTMVKLLDSFSEEDYTIEELLDLFVEYNKKRSENIGASLVAQKPVFDKQGNIIGVSSDGPATLYVYENCPD